MIADCLFSLWIVGLVWFVYRLFRPNKLYGGKNENNKTNI